MKIGLYTPYLDILGGGEKYLLFIAQYLSINHEVDIFWNDLAIKEKISKWEDINLNKINFTANVLKYNSLAKYQMLKNYDLFFYVTDGSLFLSPAKKNILIIQVPDRKMYSRDILTKIKLRSWNTKICYSEFVKNIVDPWWGTKLNILPPGIAVDKYKPLKKENIILSVGRFFPSPHCKKQDFLVRIFKEMVDCGLANWKLILCGGVDNNGREYFKYVKSLVESYPIDLYPNIEGKLLKTFYGQSEIYWHAAGFGEDIIIHPERAEHFGITTIEAMACGAVPVVIGLGGQKEIVNNGVNGFLWTSENELKEKTMMIIKDEKLKSSLSNKAILKSKDFSLEVFERKLDELLF